MATPRDPFTLAQWRRTVAELYTTVRQAPATERVQTWEAFRAARDALFREHPDSPLRPERRAAFAGLAYYPYDPTWRSIGAIERDVEHETVEVKLGTDGLMLRTRVGHVRFEVRGQRAELNVYWIKGYGGGLFLPFQDGTSGKSTYGGGRYLYDTIKGADLGVYGDEMVLDFNYSYNPSCSYDERWICPLAPVENRLSIPIEAGEMMFSA